VTITNIELSNPNYDPLTGPRSEKWYWQVLDVNDNDLGYALDGVKGGTLTFSIFNTIRGSGTMDWASADATAPDWSAIRLQPWYTATFPDGTSMSWPLGVFIPAAPKASWTDTGQTRQIQLYDKLLTLDADHYATAYQVAAGTKVTDAVNAVLADAGQVKTAITDSSETVLTTMTWAADTSHLKVINDLLASINYFSLYVDAYGWFRGDPYLPPSQRGIARTFVDDDTSIFSPKFDHTLDYFDAPNEIILIATSDGTAPALTSTAQNTSLDSPTSFPNRGYWSSQTTQGVNTTSQAVLDAMAQRDLALAMQVSSVIGLNHAPVPDIDLNDVVSFQRDPANLSIDMAVIQSMTWSTATGALVATQIQEVTT
jgi:hypothetical protein